MKLAYGYRRRWHLKIFLFLAILLGHIPLKFESHWPKDLGGDTI